MALHLGSGSLDYARGINSSRFGLATDGSTVDTAAWQSMIDTVSAAGGGLINVETPASGIYRLLDVYLKDNVWLRFNPGTVFKWPNLATQAPTSSDPAIFRLHTVDRTLTTYLKNVRLYGTIVIDGTELTPTGGDRTTYPGNPRGVMMANVQDFYIEDARGINIPGQAGNTIVSNAQGGGAQIVPNRGRIDRVTHTGSVWKGNSAIQIGGARDLSVGYAFCDNGVGFRIEAHVSGSGNTINGVTENVTCELAAAEPTDSAQKNAAVYILPHDATLIQGVKVKQVRARAGAHGLYTTHDAGATMRNIEVGGFDVEGGGQMVKSENGVQYDFTGLTIGPGQVRGSTTVGGDILPFATYRDCYARDSTLSGWRDLGLPDGTNVWSRFVGGGAKHNVGQGFEQRSLSRLELVGVETSDPPLTSGSNLLTADESGYETGAGSAWTGVSTAGVAQSAAIFHSGSKSLEVTVGSGAAGVVRTALAPSAKAVTAGQAVYTEAYVWAQNTARQCRTQVRFFDSSNVQIGADLTAAPNTTTAVGGWTKLSGYATAPAGAVQMSLFLVVVSGTAGEKFNYDDMLIATAAGTAPVQNYGINVSAGLTTVLVGGDHSRNALGASTGAGTASKSAPAAHAASHASGGSDALTLAASQVTTGQFGIARLASGTADGTKFVRDDGTLAVPPGTGGTPAASAVTVNPSGLVVVTASNVQSALAQLDAEAVTARSQARNALSPSGITYESFRRTNYSGQNIGMTGGVLMMTAVDLPAGFVIGHLSFCTGSTAIGTPTHWWFGLYDSSRVQLAVTADQLTAAWAASTMKTLAIATTAGGAASTFTTTYAGLHYLGVVTTASSQPNLAGTVINAGLNVAPILSGTSTTGLSTPSGFPTTATAITAATTMPWAGVGA